MKRSELRKLVVPLADEMGWAQSTAYYRCNHLNSFTMDEAIRLERLTKGAVKVKDIFGDHCSSIYDDTLVVELVEAYSPESLYDKLYMAVVHYLRQSRRNAYLNFLSEIKPLENGTQFINTMRRYDNESEKLNYTGK